MDGFAETHDFKGKKFIIELFVICVDFCNPHLLILRANTIIDETENCSNNDVYRWPCMYFDTFYLY
jgi:hypothetical protein